MRKGLLFLLGGAVAVLLLVIDSERRYRELQAVHARQVYQKQLLQEEQTRLRLALERIAQAQP